MDTAERRFTYMAMEMGIRGKRLRKYVSDYVVFDLETTGVSAQRDQVIEISALKVRAGEVVEEFSSLVNPGMAIPFSASRVNHITNDMVKDAPPFSAVLEEFLDFAGDMVLVGHNIHTFDMKFIWRDAEKYLGRAVENDYIDTLSLARMCLGQLSRHRLGDLAEYFGISTAGAHRALADCHMNQKVFECLGKEMAARGGEMSGGRDCPRCGGSLVKRKGRYGAFWGCSGFPNCRYTEN